MAEIVNLRRAKKARDAASRDAQAQQNRILHGRTKAEKARDQMLRELEAKNASNARLGPPEKK